MCSGGTAVAKGGVPRSLGRGFQKVSKQGGSMMKIIMLVTAALFAVPTALLLGGCMQATQTPVSDANFTARDKQLLANPPYEKAWIPPAYQRQVVQYHRKEAPGSILVDTGARYVYFMLPECKEIRISELVVEDTHACVGVGMG